MSANIEMQELHDIWRKSLLQFIVLDFIIFDIVTKIRALIPTTTLTATTIPQIIIEDPYFVEQSPIIGVPTMPAGPTVFLEDQFNMGNVSRTLFETIRSFPKPPMAFIDEIAFLERIKYYMDFTTAIFAQQLLSHVLVNPYVLRDLQKLDDKTKLDTIRNKVKGVKTGLYEYETDILTNNIMLLTNIFGKLTTRDEDTLKILLTDIDSTNTRNWSTLGNPSVTLPPGATQLLPEDAKRSAQLIEIFKLISNMLKVNLNSGIPAILVPPITTTSQVNDIVRVSLDAHQLNTVGQIWKDIFSSKGESPTVIRFLRTEIVRIFDYFEKSKSASGMEQHIAISKEKVKKYLETVLDENTESKLTELSNQPFSDAVLNNFRGLKRSLTDNLPAPRHINFLFTLWWMLKETPFLAEFHERSEVFSEGWFPMTSANPGKPQSPRVFPINLCAQIFPDIVDKRLSDVAVRSISLERMYNSRKKSFGELNRQIQIPEGLNAILERARGVSL